MSEQEDNVFFPTNEREMLDNLFVLHARNVRS
jgi:hypothetical protein